ncbi:hypothetical protein [Pontiella sulfatireligans]|uniref:hypothetical protein n=1 Tax=Pontiella sulfatireligans TaxID=2750658 RepID=UPI00109BF573|nr:hypothetical protein [Pontiella sulfatireligans]
MKHDNVCNLIIATEPAGLVFTDHEFQIKFEDEFDYHFRNLGNGTTMNWTTGVAGRFSLRAKTTAGGEEVALSQEVLATAQFPEVGEIVLDSGVVSAMDQAWNLSETLADTHGERVSPSIISSLCSLPPRPIL